MKKLLIGLLALVCVSAFAKSKSNNLCSKNKVFEEAYKSLLKYCDEQNQSFLDGYNDGYASSYDNNIQFEDGYREGINIGYDKK